MPPRPVLKLRLALSGLLAKRSSPDAIYLRCTPPAVGSYSWRQAAFFVREENAYLCLSGLWELRARGTLVLSQNRSGQLYGEGLCQR